MVSGHAYGIVHGESANIMVHGLQIVTPGLINGNKKLISLALKRENTMFLLATGEPSMPRLSIPTTERIGR
jgi:hypothetical protein